jgi:hypothetical protein
LLSGDDHGTVDVSVVATRKSHWKVRLIDFAHSPQRHNSLISKLALQSGAALRVWMRQGSGILAIGGLFILLPGMKPDQGDADDY